jgi:hypothetical protein
MLSRAIQLVVHPTCFCISFLFIDEYYSILWTYHIILIHTAVNGLFEFAHFGLLWVLLQ